MCLCEKEIKAFYVPPELLVLSRFIINKFIDFMTGPNIITSFMIIYNTSYRLSQSFKCSIHSTNMQ